MRNDDASQAGLNQAGAINARDDADHLAANEYGPATGNTITGAGTITGATGVDLAGGDARITAIEGAGGSDNSFSGGKLVVEGQYGTLTIDAEGNYSYARHPGTPAGVSDVFNYTLANGAGASDIAKLIINIGDVPMLATNGTRVVPGADGVVMLPAGVELSDVRIVGRDLVVTLPDGTTMIIVDGAVFVPQLVIDGVEVPASNLAALLIGSEPKPAAGDIGSNNQSSGGNFEVPVGPLDPGVPLGDLLPPTELHYTPPEFEEIGQAIDRNDAPFLLGSAINVSEEGLAGANPDDAPGPPQDTTNLAVMQGNVTISDPNGDPLTLTLGTPLEGLTSHGVAITWVLSNNGQLLTGSAGNTPVVTIAINNAGAYTVTLLQPIDHPNGGGENLTSITVPVSASDGDLSATGVITVNFEDDSPNASAARAASGITLDETSAGSPAGFPISATSDSAMVSAGGTFGADGPAASGATSYGLQLTGAVATLASGLFTTAGHQAITLVQTNATTISGTYGANLVAFTLVINPNGTVTYTQNVPLDHITDGSSPEALNDTNTPITLTGLVNATVTLTDYDGDSASASVAIGDRIHIFDDGPSASVSDRFERPVLTVDESPVAPNGDGIVSASASFAGAFGAVVNYGADGAGSVGYSLLLSANGIGSGLYALDPADISAGDGDGIGQGAQILLNQTNATTITGSVGGVDYFTITINGSGQVTFTQLHNVWHSNTGNPDDSSLLNTAALNNLQVVQTVTDADGDSATAAVGIGQGVFAIQDDGPNATLNGEFQKPTITVDESLVPPNGDGIVSASANFAGAFGAVVNYGTDGAGSVGYSLLLSANGIGSGLYALDPADISAGDGDGIGQGAQILLNQTNATTITGSVGGVDYFTITINGSGQVTFTQLHNVWHSNTGNPDDSSLLNTAALNNLQVVQTVTDADGDSATAAVGIGQGVFAIQDDGPNATLNGEFQKPTITVDESLVPPNGDGIVSASANFAGAFGAVVNYGTDGAGSVGYSLLLSANGIGSGLYALDPADISAGDGDGIGQGAQILLNQTNATTITGSVGGVDYFTITINGSGQVTFTQLHNVWHSNTGNPDDSSLLNTAALNNLQVVQTVTDADGDSATAAVGIGQGVFAIQDDGPNATLNGEFQKPTITVDESLVPPNGDGIVSASANFAGAFGAVVNYGTDGAGSVGYSLLLSANGIGSGLYALDPADISAGDGDGIGQGAQILLNQTNATTITGSVGGVDYFTITINGSGQVTFTQLHNVWHSNTGNPDDSSLLNTAALNNLQVVQTVTDADGDSATAAVGIGQGVFAIQDDGPNATLNGEFQKPTITVDESLVPPNGDGIVSASANFAGAFGAVVNYGTDGAGSVGYSLLLSANGIGSGLYALDPADISAGDGDGIGQGAQILLNQTNATTITGSVGGVDYFTITINGSGQVTFTQLHNVWHSNTGNPDDSSLLNTAALNNLQVVQTVTDADGDSATAAVGIGQGVFAIQDDGPNATLNGEFQKPTITVDESLVPPNGDGIVSASANFAGAFGAVVNYGTDGAGSVGYSLLLSANGIGSGLYALDPADISAGDGDGIGQGAQILLNQTNATTITGSVGGVDYFTITINGSGQVTFTQLHNVWHSNTGNPDDSSLLNTAALNNLQVVQTVTDADGDSATAAVGIGQGVFAIQDDGPNATLNGEFQKPTITVDESLVPPNGDGIVSASANFAGAFGAVVNYGTDGAGSVGYSLLLSANGIGSGLYALDPADISAGDGDGIGQGAQILLNQTNATTITGSVGGVDYFTITINGSGQVTFTQLHNVWHSNTGNPDDSSLLNTAALNNLQVVQTVTDADGDSATAAVGIGQGVFAIQDDGPNATLNGEFQKPTITVDESLVPPNGDGIVSASANFAGAFGAVVNYGTDGAGSVGYSLLLSANGIGSGLYALDPADISAGDGDGIGQGAQILLNQTNATTITGSVGGVDYFTITINGSGQVTFTQLHNVWHSNTGNPDDSSLLNTAALNNLQVVQTVTDADGDSATAAVGIGQGVFAIQDDGPNATLNGEFQKPTITVDESLVPPNGDGIVSASANFAGAFGAVVNYGTDGAGSVGYSLLLSANGIGSGLYALDPADISAGDGDGIGQGAQILLNQTNATTITGSVGGVDYFTITINGSGQVTFTQLHNVWHSNTGNPDDSSLLNTAALNNLQVVQTVTDADGDSATAAVGIGQGVFAIQDDGPSAAIVATGQNVSVDETNGNQGDSNDVTGPLAVFNGVANKGTDADMAGPQFGSNASAIVAATGSVYGTDGAGTTAFSLSVAPGGVDSGLDTTAGVNIFLFLENGIVVGRVGATAGVAATGSAAFALAINPTSGAISMVEYMSIKHLDTGSNDESASILNTAVQAVVTVTDADGDTATNSINIGSHIQFQDDGPTAAVGTTGQTISVDETAGVQGDANDVAGPLAVFNGVANKGVDPSMAYQYASNANSIVNTTGTSYGADGAGTTVLSLAVSSAGVDSGLNTTDGFDILLYVEGGIVVGRVSGGADNGKAAFAVAINSSGHLSMVEFLSIQHPNTASNDESVSINNGAIQAVVTVTDGDQDTATNFVNIGSLISFQDDGPSLIDPADAILANTAGATTTVALDIDSNVINNFGSDGPGSVQFANIVNGQDTSLNSGGVMIELWLSPDGQTLQGRTGSTNGTDGTLIYTVQINQNVGTYTVTMNGSIDNGAGISFNNLTSSAAGNVNYRGVGTNDAATPVDLLLSATAGGAAATVNTDSDSIGAANQSMDVGESLRIDFVNLLTSGAGTTTGFGYSGHASTSSFTQAIPQVQGNQAQTVSFKVWALDTSLTQTGVPDSNPAGGFSDATTVNVVGVTVTDYLSGNTTNLDISLLANGATVAVAYGISVTRNSDGSITFSGVQEGDSYGITTGVNDFNAVVVQDTAGSFDLGVLAIGAVQTGDPVNLDFDLKITDGDGDTLLVPNGIHITANPSAPPIVIDLDGDGAEFVGHSAGVMFDYGAGLVATAWASARRRHSGPGLQRQRPGRQRLRICLRT